MARPDRSARSSISSSTARYEKMRHGGIVRDVRRCSRPSASDRMSRRRVLGVSVALSEAEVHWRAFLESLVARGMRGVDFIVSDDHSGLRAARRAVLGGATWQRCQFSSCPERHPPRAQRRDPKAHRQTAEIDLGKRTISTRPKQPWLSSSPAIATPRPSWPHGSRKTSLKASPSSPYRAPPQNGCARQTRWSGPSSRSLKRRTVKVRVIPRRRRAAAPRQRRPRRDRRKMGLRHKGLHQVGMPGCMIRSQQEFPDKRLLNPPTRPTI